MVRMPCRRDGPCAEGDDGDDGDDAHADDHRRAASSSAPSDRKATPRAIERLSPRPIPPRLLREGRRLEDPFGGRVDERGPLPRHPRPAQPLRPRALARLRPRPTRRLRAPLADAAPAAPARRPSSAEGELLHLSSGWVVFFLSPVPPTKMRLLSHPGADGTPTTGDSLAAAFPSSTADANDPRQRPARRRTSRGDKWRQSMATTWWGESVKPPRARRGTGVFHFRTSFAPRAVMRHFFPAFFHMEYPVHNFKTRYSDRGLVLSDCTPYRVFFSVHDSDRLTVAGVWQNRHSSRVD